MNQYTLGYCQLPQIHGKNHEIINPERKVFKVNASSFVEAENIIKDHIPNGFRLYRFSKRSVTVKEEPA